MLSKIKEHWNKFKQYYKDHPWMNTIFVCALLAFFVIAIATPTRLVYIKQYDKGVQLYEEKQYVEAFKIFEGLNGWHISGRDGTEMYQKTLEKLNDITVPIYCPTCNQLIETTYLPLEERP